MSDDKVHATTETPQTIVERLLATDEALARVLADTDELEHRLIVWLRPAVALRRTERDHLHRRVEALSDAPPGSRIDALERKLAAARFEVAALRQSGSWRVTAPLRWLYRRLTGDARGR